MKQETLDAIVKEYRYCEEFSYFHKNAEKLGYDKCYYSVLTIQDLIKDLYIKDIETYYEFRDKIINKIWEQQIIYCNVAAFFIAMQDPCLEYVKDYYEEIMCESSIPIDYALNIEHLATVSYQRILEIDFEYAPEIDIEELFNEMEGESE